MIIITSGAYVEELKPEFGCLPPSYLPLGNRSLLNYQVNSLRQTFPEEHIILTLPETFVQTDFEIQYTKELGVEVIAVPEGISLSASILYAINISGRYEESTRILHGDTLIYDLPTQLDCLSVADSADNYDWYRIDGGLSVWSGFFAFGDTKLLIRVLSRYNEFTKAVSSYASQKELVEVKPKDWLDFGHLNTYFSARETVTTQRSFNSLQIKDGIVTKSGTHSEKIKAEGEWFQCLPVPLKPMAPSLYAITEDNGKVAYSLEYLSLLPLNELYVYGRHDEKFWNKVCLYYNQWFNKATQYISCDNIKLQKLRKNLLQIKTYERLEAYEQQCQFDLNKPVKLNDIALPSLKQIANQCIDRSLQLQPISGVFHGDLCFSNTLYDGRNNRLRFIDPRGICDDSIIGDIRYDLAKLMHSFVGLYDFIIAKKFVSKEIAPYSWIFQIDSPPKIDKIADNFLHITFDAFPPNAVQDAFSDMILLFISMLPLHDDDKYRQQGLLCNALRLYIKYFIQESAE